MINNLKISLVIPCHNEEEGIKYILENLPESIDEVVVVDNNSTDGTAALAKGFGARVVKEKRPGYGSAYKKGFSSASQDIIVTMDGDGTYPLEEIDYLVNQLTNRNLDFISGSRFPLKDKNSMLASNKLGNFILTIFFRLLTFKNIADSQSGMWVFYRSLLDQLDLKSNGMPLSEEIKMETVLNKKIKFAEVPISYKNRLGVVKLRKWKDGFENLIFLFKKRLEIKQRDNVQRKNI